jgi:hypothetical protein
MARPQNPHPNERLGVDALLTRLSDVLALFGIAGGTPHQADTTNTDLRAFVQCGKGTQI